MLRREAPDETVPSPVDICTDPELSLLLLATCTEPETELELEPDVISIKPPVADVDDPALNSMEPPSPPSPEALPAVTWNEPPRPVPPFEFPT